MAPRIPTVSGDVTVKSADDVLPGSQMPSFTWAEISKHSSPSDCWLVIRDRVYDVTEFAPTHPGGALISIAAGKDNTHMFESYHPLWVWRAPLEKYCIGTVAGSSPHIQHGVKFESLPKHAPFFRTVKERVEKMFKESKMRFRDQPWMFFKTFTILATILTGWMVGIHYSHEAASVFSVPFLISTVVTLIMGVAVGMVGVCIMHDANHGGYSENRLVSYLMSGTLDLIGASSFMWKQQHNVGHHVFTNVDGVDPDIRVSDPDVRRITENQPWRWWHRYQYVYLLVAYSLLALKSVLVDDFASLAQHKIGIIQFRGLTLKELALFWFGKVVFFSWCLFLPINILGLARGILFFVTCEAAAGLYLAYVFEVGHVVEGCEFPTYNKETKTVKYDWGALQAACTAGFSHNSWFWTYISGGLNFQIEHHLFPSICHVHYPKIAPIVRQACQEFGVSYTVYDTYLQALGSHVNVLHRAGLFNH
jgi:fatty acid desaturase